MICSFRLWLANLISGGELARLEADLNQYIEEWAYWTTLAAKRRDALMAIRDMAAPTVRRVAAIARGALE